MKTMSFMVGGMGRIKPKGPAAPAVPVIPGVTPEVVRVFDAIHRSSEFTAEVAHKAFAGVKRKK